MKNIVILFCVATTLGACSTTQDVASKSAGHSESFEKDISSLSLCVLTDLSAQERGYAFRRIVDGSTITIEAQIAVASDTPGEFVEFQLEFVPDTNGHTLVIARSKNTVWGDPVYPDTVWPIIRQCAL